MKKTRFTEAQIMGILRQMEHGVPVSGLCREHGMSSATVYKWRAKYGGMDAMPYQRDEGNGRGEPPAEAHVRRRQHAERLAEGGSWKKMIRPAQRRELAVKAVAMKGVSIALACRAFGISETCWA